MLQNANYMAGRTFKFTVAGTLRVQRISIIIVTFVSTARWMLWLYQKLSVIPWELLAAWKVMEINTALQFLIFLMQLYLSALSYPEAHTDRSFLRIPENTFDLIKLLSKRPAKSSTAVPVIIVRVHIQETVPLTHVNVKYQTTSENQSKLWMSLPHITMSLWTC